MTWSVQYKEAGAVVKGRGAMESLRSARTFARQPNCQGRIDARIRLDLWLRSSSP